MFAALSVFALVAAHVTAELPSYIHPCGRKEPNYEQCLARNFEDMKYKICSGMPELNIPPTEPFVVDKLVIYDTANTKLYLRDAKVYGFCDAAINSIYTDSDRQHLEFDVSLKHLLVDATYDFDIHILTQIAHKGKVHLTTDIANVKLGIDLKTITKNGVKYAYTSKIKVRLDIKEFNYEFDETEKELVDLHKILNNVIITNKEEMKRKVIPSLEKEISKKIISTFNDILRQTRYEEIFPETTQII